jgi:hypothetical protein
LRFGSQIRFVRLPTFQGKPGGGLLPETLELYERLIARGRASRVYQVDKDGLPWIRCQFRRESGQWEYHYLAINDDSWELVKSRAGG